jgi:hypothetical protein
MINQMTAKQRRQVENFKIWNKHCSIQFKKAVDLTGVVHLSEIVKIQKAFVQFYPETSVPARGSLVN